MQLNIKGTLLNCSVVNPEQLIESKVVCVFLHEALGSIGQWKDFPTELCNKLGIKGFVYERQGHGESDPLNSNRTANYLHDYALKELPLVLDQLLENDQKVLLVGHSDGGSISLINNHYHPEKVHGIITMAAHVINEPETRAGIEPAVQAYVGGKLTGLNKFHGSKTEDLFYAWANIWRDESFLNWDLTNEISSDNPALVMQGRNDQYGTVKQLELIKKNYGKCIRTVLINDCGHHPHLEQMDKVLEEIFIWYKTLDQATILNT